MERFAMTSLKTWKQSKRRKPLIISGARQVGKTWLMKEFGRTCYDRTAYITFDNNPNLVAAFDESLSPRRLIPILQAEAGITIDENTLLILDEIQESPRAIQALKYFVEEAPELSVVAGGSALGLTLHRGRQKKSAAGPTGSNTTSAQTTSFPVGKVSFLDLYPLSFLEFLLAIGEDQLAALILTLDWNLLEPFHQRLTELLRQYIFVGGMPEAVLAFSDSFNPLEARDVHNELLRSYNADFSKYADDVLAERIRLLWRAIPANLAKENRKFMFSKVKESARAREYEDALQWLSDASLVNIATCVELPDIPLASHEDESVFKVFTLDVGLLGAMNNLSPKAILSNDEIFSSYKGALGEQFIAQEILASGQAGNNLDPGNSLHYFVNQATRTEIDFVEDGNRLISQTIPIEAKAGKNTRAKSLVAYIKKYQPELAIRASLAPGSQDDVLHDVPLYAFGAFYGKVVTGFFEE